MATPKITIDDVRHVAKLAALALSPADEQRMCQELQSILSFIAALDEVDVAQVPPTFHAVPMSSALRPDVVATSLPREEILRAAPRQEAGGFAVPKVMEGEG